MIRLLKKIFVNQPTKWGNGISVLWSGMNISLYAKSLFGNEENSLTDNQFTFESARSSIYHYLKYKGIGKSDEVIVTSFTCDAVTKAVIASGAKIIYSDINNDLSMNFEDIQRNISPKTKLIICQNSFGVYGLKIEQLKQIKDKKIPVLLDNCLSYGSIYQKEYIDLFEAEICSFEVSKIICIGWGGIITIYNKSDFENYYNSLNKVTKIEDIRRVIQVILNLVFVGKGNLLTQIFWHILMITGVFRKSESSSKKLNKSKKLGKYSKKTLSNVLKHKDEIFSKTKHNFDKLLMFTHNLGYKTIYDDENLKNVISCRLPLLINKSERDNFKYHALKNFNLEIGTWFDELPEEIHSEIKLKNTEYVNSCIVNLPCYWNLQNEDILIIKEFLTSYIHYK